MNKNKIAILIDSGTDVPAEILALDNVFVLPLRIIFKDGEFIDKVNIDGDELFRRMATEIPGTSLPSGEDIIGELDKIREAGFQSVLGVTISSGLSGTHNFVRNIFDDYDDLETIVFDTKNIGVAAGMFVSQAVKLIDDGLALSEVVPELEKSLTKTRVFFTVGTLDYLRKGGRIGLVAGTIGEMLNLKPIIACNDEGVYYTVDKVRGKKKSYAKLIELAKEYASHTQGKVIVAITFAGIHEDFVKFKADLLEKFGAYDEYFEIQVSPTLGVHTGPDAMGVAVQIS